MISDRSVTNHGRRRNWNSLISRVAAIAAVLSVPGYSEGIRCWVRCHDVPPITSAADVPAVLRRSPNPSLNLIARGSGLVTTYPGKMLGIQGWRDYQLSARVVGRVVQAAGSTDLFYTIDLMVDSLRVSDENVNSRADSFIRVEVLPRVRVGAPLPVHPREVVCVSGKLMWDGDGFLEIHPSVASDIQVNSCH